MEGTYELKTWKKSTEGFPISGHQGYLIYYQGMVSVHIKQASGVYFSYGGFYERDGHGVIHSGLLGSHPMFCVDQHRSIHITEDGTATLGFERDGVYNELVWRRRHNEA